MGTDEQGESDPRLEGVFPSDVTDAEWAVLGRPIPDAFPNGRPRQTDMRSAMDAILFLLRTGRSRRYLPRDGLPPRLRVYNIVRRFKGDGPWHATWNPLYPVLRDPEDREGSPWAGVISSQTIASAKQGGGRVEKQATEAAEAVGYEPGKTVKGRRIHSLVETRGLPIRLVVHSAGLQDSDGAAPVSDEMKPRLSWLECLRRYRLKCRATL